MILTRLKIGQFRNIEQALLSPCASFNLLTGHNGAGKSAVLEAIHCLSCGHSFRTRKIKELISHNQDNFILTSQMTDHTGEKSHRAGLLRNRDGTTSLRLDYEPLTSMTSITQMMPVKALTPDSHGLIQDGPRGRRQFMDWGTFHVEPSFFGAWKHFRRALAQRNQALKDNANDSEIDSWDEQLIDAGSELTEMRKRYIGELGKQLQTQLQEMETAFHVEHRFKQGWTEDMSLEDALARSRSNCRRFRTTTVGPHRADLQIDVAGHAAREVLSRGQQKTLIYALHMAQLSLLHSLTENRAIVLCDDLTAELDKQQIVNILTQLQKQGSQVFLTATEPFELPSAEIVHFSVTGGDVQKSV
ncbi:MAG: DNA replication/repair protein RecF [Granulosicoccaceae bacterium]